MSSAEVTPLAERERRARPPLAADEPRPDTPRASRRDHPVRVVVVCDDPKLRHEVATRVVDDEIVLLAAIDCVEAYDGLRPDAVVVPHRLLAAAEAIDVCERLGRTEEAPALVVVSFAPRALLLRRVVQAGASGFVAAESPAAVLREAVRAAAAGHPYFDPAVGALIVGLIAGRTVAQRPHGLTPAQLDVVALLPKGLRNREIASELGITENTVKTHLRHALRKLGVRNRAQAAALVKKEGLA
jgi:DNA-binding NarL/FixJ family response regulator